MMTMTIPFSVGRTAVLLAVVFSTGCATKGDLRNIQTELRGLAARQDSLMAALQRQNRSTQDTMRQTSNQLFEIRGDVSSRLGAIENSIDRLSERMGQMQQGMVDIRDQLGSGANVRNSGGMMGGDPLTGGASNGDAVALYNAAVRSYNMGSFNAAKLGFETFLDAHPGDELVPEAYYFLAESLIQLGDPEGAIDAYEAVFQNHPDSDAAPKARVGLGRTYLEQGESALARNQFEMVVNTWPESEAAAQASAALAGMGGSPF